MCEEPEKARLRRRNRALLDRDDSPCQHLIPAWDSRVIDLSLAAESKTYCDEYKGRLREMRLEPTELAGYLAGQVLAVHPAYELLFEAFHPPGLKGRERTEWAAGELKKCIA